MTSSALMPVRCMNGNWILRRRKLNSSPEFLMNENIATNLRRSLLHQKVVLRVRSLIDHLWMLYLDPNLRTLIIKNLVSPFGDLPSSLPTRLAREHRQSLKPSAETGTHLPLTGPIPVNRDSAVGTRSPKVLSPLAPLTRKVGEAEAARAANRKEQLPVGGKLVHFQDSWTKLFPQHPEIAGKFLKVSWLPLTKSSRHFFVTRWSCQATTKQPTSSTLFRNFDFRGPSRRWRTLRRRAITAACF